MKKKPRHILNSRLHRFFGDGNCSVEDADGHRKKTWRVQCRACNGEEHLHLARGFLPPDIVVKKFQQKGWSIGNRAEDDLCGDCRAAPAEHTPLPPQPPPSTADELRIVTQRFKAAQGQVALLTDEVARLRAANKALRDLNTTFQNQDEEFTKANSGLFELLREVHEALLNGSGADSIMRKIETTFPKWPWPQRLPKKKGSLPPVAGPKAPDPEFDRWLAELEQERAKDAGKGQC